MYAQDTRRVNFCPLGGTVMWCCLILNSSSIRSLVGADITNSGIYLESTPGTGTTRCLEVGRQAYALHCHKCLSPLGSEALWPLVNIWKKEAKRAELADLTSFSLCVVFYVSWILATRGWSPCGPRATV